MGKMSRRKFVTNVAATSAGFAIVPRHVLGRGQTAPSDRLNVAALTSQIAAASCRLPEPFHADPADRMIVATARELRATIVTADARILAYGRAGHVRALR